MADTIGDPPNRAGEHISDETLTGHLVCADFSGTLFERVRFESPSAELAVFTEAEFSDVVFTGGDYVGANFSKARFVGVSFVSVNLRSANFGAAELVNVTWEDVTCPSGRSSDDLGRSCQGAGV